jgi:hypothetical protein
MKLNPRSQQPSPRRKLVGGAFSIAVLFLTTGTAHAKAIFQCGPFKIAFERDAKSDSGLKGWKITQLAGPIGDFPFDVKDGEIYIDGYLCKPACEATTEQKC